MQVHQRRNKFVKHKLTTAGKRPVLDRGSQEPSLVY